VGKRLCRLPIPYRLLTDTHPANLTENFEHETERKTPVRKAKIKMMKICWKICHVESRKRL